jgi:hypothetical protein
VELKVEIPILLHKRFQLDGHAMFHLCMFGLVFLLEARELDVVLLSSFVKCCLDFAGPGFVVSLYLLSLHTFKPLLDIVCLLVVLVFCQELGRLLETQYLWAELRLHGEFELQVNLSLGKVLLLP